MVTKGGTIEEIEIGILNKSTILAVSDLPTGETEIFSPIGQPDHVFFIPSDPPTPSGISLIERDIKLSFLFANPQIAIDFSKTVMSKRITGEEEVEVGTHLIDLTHETLSSYKLKLLSPSLDRDKYQLLLIIDNPKTGETLNFSFKNLLTDEKGRFILMVPSPNLEEDSSNTEK